MLQLLLLDYIHFSCIAPWWCLLVVTHMQYITLGTLQPRALGVLNHVDPFDFMFSWYYPSPCDFQCKWTSKRVLSPCKTSNSSVKPIFGPEWPNITWPTVWGLNKWVWSVTSIHSTWVQSCEVWIMKRWGNTLCGIIWTKRLTSNAVWLVRS